MTKKKKTATKRKPKTARKKTKKQQKSPLKFLLKWSFVLGLWATIFVAAIVAWYASELPEITERASFERETSITVLAADDSVIARYGDLMGQSVTVEDLPPHLIHAVLSIEDRRFYSHFGIDIFGFTRAMVVNIQKQRYAQGGSTITQQLAKNLFLSQERTIKRKIQEALLALWLEHELSKDEILSAYLNRVYLGSGAYGVDAAAERYFDKPVADLSIRESATLAGLLKAPSRYSPLQNPTLSRERTDVVLASMVDAGYLAEDKARHLFTPLPAPPESRPTGQTARYFSDWIVDGLDDLIGTPTEDLIIKTTYNPKVQKIAADALTDVIRTHGEEKKISQGGVIVMRPNGAVVAMVGGLDYGISQFNRITQARRQPGSSFKPFVYLAALEHGYFPNTLVVDEKITEGKYRPKNFGHKYYGELTLENALWLSLNTIAIGLIRDVGAQQVANTARRMGIFSPLLATDSLALGTNEVSPLELASAYAVLANGGYATFPYAITKITNEDGKLYYQRPARRKSRRVVDEFYTQTLTNMMTGVLEHGTGRGAKLPYPAAGKTGTSQDSRDAWFMGFTDQLVTGVWLGNDDNSPMKRVTGGAYPAQIWRTVMAKNRGRYPAVNANNFDVSGFEGLLGKLLNNDGRPSSPLIRWNDQEPAAGTPTSSEQRLRQNSDNRKNKKHVHQRKSYND